MKSVATCLLRAAPFAAAALLFTGCVGVVPRPVSATKVENGRRLKPADVAFMQPGVTTHAQVVARLGSEYIALPQDRAIAYSWEMKGGGGFSWVCLFIPFGAPAGTQINIRDFSAADARSWTGGWRTFFIAFDDLGVVRAMAFKSPSTRMSLHEHLYAWIQTLPAQPKLLSGGRTESNSAPLLPSTPE